MDLLAIIIVLLALIAAGGIIYAAWELSSDKPPARSRSGAEQGGDRDNPPDR